MLGVFLGWQPMLLTVLIASVAGSLVGFGAVALGGRDMRHTLPFGTFLKTAGIAIVFFGEPILSWYQGLFGG
jgi:leader peptidase (prepilin peptidase)/N-methyltransferase